MALALGRTINELENSMGSHELSEWIAYYNIEPFGSDLEAIRFGSIASMIANVNRDSKKRSKAYESQDFAIAGKGMQDSIKNKKSINTLNMLMGIASK